jgi:hypothetical protein
MHATGEHCLDAPYSFLHIITLNRSFSWTTNSFNSNFHCAVEAYPFIMSSMASWLAINSKIAARLLVEYICSGDPLLSFVLFFVVRFRTRLERTTLCLCVVRIDSGTIPSNEIFVFSIVVPNKLFIYQRRKAVAKVVYLNVESVAAKLRTQHNVCYN